MTEKSYFLTVERCNDGCRGVFCNKHGSSFRQEDRPHTQDEMYDVLGVFSIVLAPESLPLTEEELSKFTYFRPLAEYTNEYGVALEESDVPLKEQND